MDGGQRGSDARAVEATCCLLGSLRQEGVSKGVGLTWAEAGGLPLPSWGARNFDGGWVRGDHRHPRGQWPAVSLGQRPRARVAGEGGGRASGTSGCYGQG